MKFTITIDELLHAYSNRQSSDETFLCHYIQYNLLPRRSILHKIYFWFSKPSNQFITLVAKEFNCTPCLCIESMLHDHPDFKDIPTHHSSYYYRLKTLNRIKELKPNLTLTLNY